MKTMDTPCLFGITFTDTQGKLLYV